MSDFSTILWPTDFSDASRHALNHGIAIAKWYGARIVGLHVRQPAVVPVSALGTMGPVGELAGVQTASEVEFDVSACLEPARAAGLATDARVDEGSPANGILKAANALPADLVVIGTHGTSGFEHLVLGSVTEKILRKATCPILTVPPRARATSKLPFKRLLCPVDFSDSSVAALRLAFSFAQEADAALTILHVLEWPPEDEPRVNRAFNVPEYGRHRERDASTQLERLVPDTVRAWCTPATRIAHGKPYREILGVATEDSTDLIVIGVHGRHALDLMVFGSTTNQVVRRATCPVLTLRPKS